MTDRTQTLSKLAEELVGDFLAAGVAGVGAIGSGIVLFPDELVAGAALGAIGPEVRAPEQAKGSGSVCA